MECFDDFEMDLQKNPQNFYYAPTREVIEQTEWKRASLKNKQVPHLKKVVMKCRTLQWNVSPITNTAQRGS